MVFMIKLPPSLSMSSPVESNRKDDRVSLMKSLHKPYGQLDADQRNNANENQYHNQLQHYTSQLPRAEPQRQCVSPKHKMALVSGLMITASLVVIIVSMTSYGQTLTTNVQSLRISEIMEDAPSSTTGEVIVKTSCGRIQGTTEGNAYVFKGIPYSKPPLGALRWRKPVPLWIEDNWCKQNRLHQATEFGSRCYQLNPYTKQHQGDEDCLYINVWTPSLAENEKLDVMVFVHGGFLQFGSGHEKGLRPSGQLAKKLNVVFVSFNFRLYTFGFMALDILAQDVMTDSRGNYGLWDQVCALQWIKDNIQHFGGDPKKVSLFGPDSGAASILALMSSPKAQGLFRTAWLTGNTMTFNKTFSEVSAHNRAHFLQRSNCKVAECLRSKRPQEVVSAHLGKDDPSFRIRDQNDLPIQGIFPEQLIVVDGELVKRFPPESFQDKQIKTIPILMGTSSQAVDFWPGPDDLSTWTWSQYKKYVTTSLDSFGLQVSKMALSIYNGTAVQIKNPAHTAEYLYTTMVSDIRQTCPVNELAKQLAAVSRSSIYRYTLTATPSVPAKIFNYKSKYSFHPWDLIAFLDTIEDFVDEPNAEDYEFRNLMQKTIMAFVKSGGLQVDNLDWLRYPKKLAELGRNITFGDITKTECKFWSESGLGIYAWVS